MGDRSTACRPSGTLQAFGMAILICAGVGSPGAAAGEIVRWVDAEGVTHFTDAHLAAAPAEVVEVNPANAMVVPTGSATESKSSPALVKISKAPKKNKKRNWPNLRTNLNRGRGYRRR
jgi:hypothetical protein